MSRRGPVEEQPARARAPAAAELARRKCLRFMVAGLGASPAGVVKGKLAIPGRGIRFASGNHRGDGRGLDHEKHESHENGGSSKGAGRIRGSAGLSRLRKSSWGRAERMHEVLRRVEGRDWIARDGLETGGRPVLRPRGRQGHGVRPSSGALERRFTHTLNAILRRGCPGGFQGGGGRPHSRTLRVRRGLAGSGLVVVHSDRKSGRAIP